LEIERRRGLKLKVMRVEVGDKGMKLATRIAVEGDEG
jgi:hypothetical protein